MKLAGRSAESSTRRPPPMYRLTGEPAARTDVRRLAAGYVACYLPKFDMEAPVEPDRKSRIIAAALLIAVVVAVGSVALWIVPEALTQQVSRDLTTSERLTAVNDARAPVVAFIVAVGAAGSLWFTARTYTLSREGHVTERYTRAVGQLGDDSMAVRVGGVYALERIGNDSAKDRTTIVYVLGAFIRERSKVIRDRQDDPNEDVKAGLRAASRLLKLSSAKLDLRDADLRNADLSGFKASQLLLDGARLDGARHPLGA